MHQDDSLPDSPDNLDLETLVARGRTLLARAVQRGWTTGTLTRPEDGALSAFLTTQEIQDLVDRVTQGRFEARHSSHSSQTEEEARIQPSPRLQRLLTAIDATPVAPDLLSVLLAAEIDPHSRALTVFLRGGIPGSAPSVDTLLLALGPSATRDILAEVGAGSGLHACGLLHVASKSDALTAATAVRLVPRFLRWFLAPTAADREITPFATLCLPDAQSLPPRAMLALDALIADVQTTIAARVSGRSDRFDVVLHGPRGTGRTEIALEACRRLRRPALLTSLAALSAQEGLHEAVTALLREELLLDAQVVLLEGELLADGSPHAVRLRASLSRSMRPLIVLASGPDRPRLSTGRRLLTYDVSIVEAHEREALWSELLPSTPSSEIASLYRIGVGAILRCAVAAMQRAGVRGDTHPTLKDVAASVRAEFATDLGTVAMPVKITQGWDDVVLPEATGQTIVELLAQIKHRSTVLGHWGFQQKLGRGLGTTALFTGEPGTGKSMVAGLIAKELGLELYQVDLSRTVSKWLGETEKNLARVFDAAETGHVVLLFDEADTLLGKRTADVKSANDRYANMETNYILQRLEAFHGIAILTSNLGSAIDPALARRISFVVQFPFPDPAQREELWRRIMPRSTPLGADIDYRLLAERFEISGGHIRNIALRAAYLAVDTGAPCLGMKHILSAAENEYRDHGRLEAKGRLAK